MYIQLRCSRYIFIKLSCGFSTRELVKIIVILFVIGKKIHKNANECQANRIAAHRALIVLKLMCFSDIQLHEI